MPTAKRAQNDALGAVAAEAVSREPSPGDPPAEVAANIADDYTAQSFDPYDPATAAARAGEALDPNMEYRWVNVSERRLMDIRAYEGWSVAFGGKIRRGEQCLAQMPRARYRKRQEAFEAKNRALANAPMDRFDDEAGRIARSGEVRVFDGSAGPNDGIR